MPFIKTFAIAAAVAVVVRAALSRELHEQMLTLLARSEVIVKTELPITRGTAANTVLCTMTNAAPTATSTEMTAV